MIRVLGIVALLTVTASALWWVIQTEGTASYRYKLTLAVDTPDGVKRASTVGEVKYRKVTVPARGTMYKLQGDALYLDLGPNAKPLIALLTHRLPCELHRRCAYEEQHWSRDGGPGAMHWIYGLTLSEDWMDDVARLARMRGPRAIAPANLPDLVTFADINDPNSVIEVNPNDLQATLGPGITWNGITLESTDEPVTMGIRTRLPWLPTYFEKNLRLDGSQIGRPNLGITNILSWFDFEQSIAPRRK